ncbi:hypothetical protein ASF71_20620 [Deinococcus sp. Leaf326]|nr:hypothetical protein ASF71_20620 [Deinococcus sp. Leaf326]
MLTEDEQSRPVRVRAPVWVHDRLKGMTAAQVGELLTQALAGRDWSMDKSNTVPTSPASATAPAVPTPGASLEGRTQLQVIAHQIPQAMKNKMRWSSDRYATLEALLAANELLTLDVTNGKSIWRTATGESIRSDTVLRLLGAGLLA